MTSARLVWSSTAAIIMITLVASVIYGMPGTALASKESKRVVQEIHTTSDNLYYIKDGNNCWAVFPEENEVLPVVCLNL